MVQMCKHGTSTFASFPVIDLFPTNDASTYIIYNEWDDSVNIRVPYKFNFHRAIASNPCDETVSLDFFNNSCTSTIAGAICF